MPDLDDQLAEAQRQVTICNACRYCEGYCAAFPAMELRDSLTAGDLGYIANLCHDCRACYQACPYTPPHEFAINIPDLLATARLATYSHYAKPRALRAAFSPKVSLGLALSAVAAAIVVTVGLMATVGLGPAHSAHTGDPYTVVSYGVMMIAALLLTLYGLMVVGVGCARLLRDAGQAMQPTGFGAFTAILSEIATLRWMRGGGAGCHYPDAEEPSSQRRWLHQLLALGFLSAFAATVAAAIEQHILGDAPPYAFLSAPVLLGLVGGAMMLIGTAGLAVLKARESANAPTIASRGLDIALLVVLGVVAASGIALLFLRRTSAMGPMLVFHLLCVALLFMLIPHGKLIHAPYRAAALLARQRELRRDVLSLTQPAASHAAGDN
jgi:citrate/tricarballylate utilization protein